MLEKYFLGVVLLLFSKFGLAQLDSNLVPCADLYDLMWDSLNVNKPHALVKDINFNTTLLLSEDSSCSFQHPISFVLILVLLDFFRVFTRTNYH